MSCSSGSGATSIVLATRNPHKAGELRLILGEGPWELTDLAAYPELALPPEGGMTFAENALSKARAVARETGQKALADDSGLVVPVLNGEPGIRSSRFAGSQADDEANRGVLLKRMREIQGAERAAEFVAVLALICPSGQEHVFEGRCQGRILEAPRGSGGFGYDPLFYSLALSRSFAELSPEAKAVVSHRGQAGRQLRNFLLARLSTRETV